MAKGDIMVLRTLQGSEYIGKLEEETDVSFVLNDVYVVGFQTANGGEVQVGMGPVVHPALGKINTSKNGAVDRISFPRTAVLLTYEPSDDIENYYRKSTSGIEVARVMPGNM